MKIKVGDKISGKYLFGERIRNKKVYGIMGEFILLRDKYGYYPLTFEKLIYGLNSKYTYCWFQIENIENLKIN